MTSSLPHAIIQPDFPLIFKSPGNGIKKKSNVEQEIYSQCKERYSRNRYPFNAE